MADSSTIAVELAFATLPEGWKGTPQQFLNWIAENAIFSATGAFLTGQIGGARPVSNVGIWVNGRSIELWDSATSKYVPQLTVPIGVVLDWPAPNQAPPENYLFAEGQLLLQADYPDLYPILLKTYSRPGDATNTFRLPDYRGRVGVGASNEPGNFNPLADTGEGVMTLRALGSYFGAEWPSYALQHPLNAHTPRYSAALQGRARPVSAPYQWNKSPFNGIQPPSIGVRKIIRYK